ncbi:MAG: hypothetical protein GX620_14235 [Chloroflexi bacterium]|nr:hypothetical protein [Chloroflexota bacterium]
MGERLDALLRAINGLDRLLIMPHNNPDPDAIASALALRFLLDQVSKVSGQLAYVGLVGRSENKALVRYLDYPSEPVHVRELDEQVPWALVDTQPGAGNNPWHAGISVAIVIDHHHLRETTALAAFADVRQDIGATSTLLTQYLREANIEPSPRLATALLYGIKSDTLSLSRGARQADVDAYLYLLARADIDALTEIERAQVPAGYFKSLVGTLMSACVYDHVVIAYAGAVVHPDFVAEMADSLLRLQGAQWVIAIGIYRERLVISVRTNGSGGAGALVQHIVGDRGTAGGHGVLAAGDIPLSGDDPAKLAEDLAQRALRYLNVSSEVIGRKLVDEAECGPVDA